VRLTTDPCRDAGLALVALARHTIESRLLGTQPPARALDERLAMPGAAFVTVTVNGVLRGCIGRVDASDPLAAVVTRCAIGAAFEDPRFAPIDASDLPDLRVHVSVLTPLVPLDDVEMLEVGRHGLVVQHGHRHGLLLPQVAAERGWSPVDFLEHTCLKAGLSRDAWREGAELYVFEAEVFHEDE
jgi:uncharacterized protein